jgi:hypothetical protein
MLSLHLAEDAEPGGRMLLPASSRRAFKRTAAPNLAFCRMVWLGRATNSEFDSSALRRSLGTWRAPERTLDGFIGLSSPTARPKSRSNRAAERSRGSIVIL